MVQLPQGSDARPSSAGSVYMMYRRVMKPTDSMAIQPHFPEMLRRDSIDVLPMGYQSVSHWMAVIWFLRGLAWGLGTSSMGSGMCAVWTYDGE